MTDTPETRPLPWLDLRDDGAARAVVVKWWHGLDHERGDRAALRRAQTPEACAFVESYHRLRQTLEKDHALDCDALAVVAAVLAHLKEHRSNRRLPRSLRGELSPLRLRRLLHAEDAAEILRLLRRFLPLAGGVADAADVARWAYALASPVLRERAARDFAHAFYDATTLVDTDDDASAGESADAA